MVGSGSMRSDIHKKQPHGFGEKYGKGLLKAQLYRKFFSFFHCRVDLQ